MKILQIHVGMSLFGGVEGMVCGLSNEMIKEHDVTVCAVFKPSEHSPFYKRLSPDIKKEHLGIDRKDPILKSLWRVWKYFSKSDADIIHIHGFFHYYAIPIVLFHRGHKIVYTFHSDAFMENQKWEKRILWLKKYCLRRGWMHPVTISPESQQSFTQLYHIDSRLILNGIVRPKETTKANVVDLAKVTPQTKVFLHPGRISTPKNQVVLCRVFQRLIEEGNDVMLLMVGNCQDVDIYKQIEPYLKDRIKYLGERDDVPQLLSHAEGFCLPSIWEGLPLALLEALAVGCVPICSPVGGILGVIKDGENGVLSRSSNEEDYYVAMKRYLTMRPEEVNKLKKSARDSFTPYDIQKSAYDYVLYYRELLNDGR